MGARREAGRNSEPGCKVEFGSCVIAAFMSYPNWCKTSMLYFAASMFGRNLNRGFDGWSGLQARAICMADSRLSAGGGQSGNVPEVAGGLVTAPGKGELMTAAATPFFDERGSVDGSVSV